MSTDLKYLAFTAIPTASLWIPYVVAQVTTKGPLDCALAALWSRPAIPKS